MSNYDERQIERGIEIEKEHQPTLEKLKKDVSEHGKITLSPRDVYESISEDHLDEFDDYYTSLTEMENQSEERTPQETQKRVDEGPKELKETAVLRVRMVLSALDSQEQEQEQEQEQPTEEDVVISKDESSAFYGGKRIVIVNREQLDKDPDAIEKAIAKWMVENSFFPNVFYVNDHGNVFNRSLDVSKYVRLRQLKERRKP